MTPTFLTSRTNIIQRFPNLKLLTALNFVISVQTIVPVHGPLFFISLRHRSSFSDSFKNTNNCYRSNNQRLLRRLMGVRPMAFAAENFQPLYLQKHAVIITSRLPTPRSYCNGPRRAEIAKEIKLNKKNEIAKQTETKTPTGSCLNEREKKMCFFLLFFVVALSPLCPIPRVPDGQKCNN